MIRLTVLKGFKDKFFTRFSRLDCHSLHLHIIPICWVQTLNHVLHVCGSEVVNEPSLILCHINLIRSNDSIVILWWWIIPPQVDRGRGEVGESQIAW